MHLFQNVLAEGIFMKAVCPLHTTTSAISQSRDAFSSHERRSH